LGLTVVVVVGAGCVVETAVVVVGAAVEEVVVVAADAAVFVGAVVGTASPDEPHAMATSARRPANIVNRARVMVFLPSWPPVNVSTQ
jgi:carbonic anhydrase/acetyltransferase-like protein (isoleucine patch superfamily)